VRLYSNPKVRLETLQQLLPKATSAHRSPQWPAPRQKQIRLDAHQSSALAAAYRDGKTIKELAQRYGVHRTTVSALLRRSDVELRRGGLTSGDVLAVSQMYASGWSLAKLGRKFGVDAATVWRALLAAGVVMRSPRGRSR
jgi:lambda repressor-like predicted transcriptional regulator